MFSKMECPAPTPNPLAHFSPPAAVDTFAHAEPNFVWFEPPVGLPVTFVAAQSVYAFLGMGFIDAIKLIQKEN